MIRSGTVVLLLATLACAEAPPAADTYIFRGDAMGTTYSVKVVSKTLASERQQEMTREIGAELETVDAAMSNYREDSELSALNRHRETTPVPLSRETFAVLAQALTIGRLTDGAFDVTVGPLVEAWGFGPRGEPKPPSPEELERLRALTGYDRLKLEIEDRAVVKERGEIELDLSAIAKGHAVDRVAGLLDREGFSDYLVEIGGELRARGVNAEGVVWRVGVEQPVAERGQVQRLVPLDNRSMATSGDYRNYREERGERISHIIDPRSGRPIRHRLASATVIASDCATADAWATALMVLGPDEGMRRAEAQGLAVLLLVRDDVGGYEERASRAFTRILDEASS